MRKMFQVNLNNWLIIREGGKGGSDGRDSRKYAEMVQVVIFRKELMIKQNGMDRR